MTTYKRGDRWYYDFMIRGERYRSAIPEARTKAQAERVETLAREDIYNRRFSLPGETITFEKFVNETYLPWARIHKRSFHTDELRIKSALQTFGKSKLADIAPIQIEKYKRERIATPAQIGRQVRERLFQKHTPRSAATVNAELAILSKVLGMAADQGLIRSNPVRKVKKLPLDNKRTRVCSSEEEELLRTWLSPGLLPLFIITINTGMRLGELVGLTWNCIDFGKGTITIKRSKTGRGRTIPINAEVRAILENLFDNRLDDSTIFRSRLGKQYGRPNVTFAAICQRLRIDDLHWHDLRHTAASRLADAGASPFVIAEILGHADLRQTARYTHATSDAKRRAVEAISGYSDEQQERPKIVSIAERRARG